MNRHTELLGVALGAAVGLALGFVLGSLLVGILGVASGAGVPR